MKFFPTDQSGTTAIGLAIGPTARTILDDSPEWIDYVEIPFEQIRHDPACREIQQTIPTIMHCASMSVAGFVLPAEETISAIAQEANRMRTPWIGEHLAFLSAESLDVTQTPHAPPTSLTYTVCPQLSEETLIRVAKNLDSLSRRFECPLIVENSPQYFKMPGDEMGMVDFLIEVLSGGDTNLLLDLSHFVIMCINMGCDPHSELKRLPLSRIVEVHLSGYSLQSGRAWDDHSNPATELEFELLDVILQNSRPRAITFEYNWGTDFPESLVVEHLQRTRNRLEVTA